MATYTNPVWAKDFPDPHVLAHGGKFYAYATETAPYRFQVMESPDLVHWTHKGTAFTVPWSREHYWAPEVIEYRGQFYMTYSALHPETRKHDIGIAVAKSPLGPFEHKAILVRAGDNRVGVIDTTVHFEGRTPYLLYTEEDPRRILIRKLTPDLITVDGDPTKLIEPTEPWERGCTEAPTLLKRNGMYHLIYSGGWFQSSKNESSYCVAHAESKSLMGPYTKTGQILTGDGKKVYGPGHQCVVTLKNGEDWLLYHAWDDQNEPRYGSNPLGRTLRLDRLEWQGNRPKPMQPTLTEQPAPKV
ncbi:MAG: glycoside hydrolase family 43 protein [Armatimonadaceae bacterium]